MRLVASLTSLPNRYAKLHRTLMSLHAQKLPFDLIYVTLPRWSRRLQQPYPPLPEETASLVQIIYVDVDYGPLTKIMGALLQESSDSTIIVTCDDDVIYQPNLTTVIAQYQEKYPQAALGGEGMLVANGYPWYSFTSNSFWTGFAVVDDVRTVDVLCGYGAVAYRRKFFPSSNELAELSDKALQHECLYYNDDVLLSGFLAKQGISRLIVRNWPKVNVAKVNDPELDQVDAQAISYDKYHFVQRFRLALNQLHQDQWFTNHEAQGYDESVIGRGLILLVLIFLIVIWLCLHPR